jgi:type I restriction enzyme S subunit
MNNRAQYTCVKVLSKASRADNNADRYRGIPLLSIRNIQGHAFGLRDDDSLISEQDYSELSRSFVPEPDDVMLAIVGATIGKAAIVPSGIGRFHIQRSLAIFRSKPELLVAKWLLGVFGSIGFNSLLWQNVGFSAQPGIYLGVLKDIRIPVPPKKEQEEILARLEKSINDQSQILSVASHSVDLLQERRSALISAAVTGQIDVRGLVPEAVAA